MALNLHAIVRGAIASVNPDRSITWTPSSGNTVAAGGRVSPSYDTPVTIDAQIQPVRTGDIKKYSFLQAQGVFRAVYLFGEKSGIDRVEAKGGDLLAFAEVEGGTVRTWLVKAVDEQWSVGDGNWCRVIAVLQLDRDNPP